MNIPMLPPGVVKYHRESNGHYYIWDGCFTTPLYDLNDPPLGLGTDINEVYGDSLTAIEVETADDDEFQAWKDFLEAQRDLLVIQIANAVSG